MSREIKQKIIAGAFGIAQVKIFPGHDECIYRKGVLLKEGKKVATWSDNPYGGPFELDFQSKADEQEFYALAEKHPYADKYRASMGKYANTLTGYDFAHFLIHENAVEWGREQSELEKLKRDCKRKIVLYDAGNDEYFEIAQPYHDGLKAQIMAKYPNMEIVNLHFLSES